MYKVLIVDDEALMREALRMMVSKIDGFQVADSVGTGEEAVKACCNEKIDIVFMDIRMPGISGLEASKAIYALDSSIAIYIISAYRNFKFAQEAVSVNIREYISKPTTFSEIARILGNYKQNQSVGEGQLDRLVGLLERCRYDQIQTLVPEIVQEAFKQESDNASSLQNRFVQIGQNLFKSTDLLGRQEINFENRFPINYLNSGKIVYWNLWFFDIMDYAFRQSAILKCGYLQSVFSYIDENITENINASQISTMCGISQGYLSRRFKQHMGVSVMDYIHFSRIRRAKVNIAYTDLSMADIAFQLGYSESSYFTKVFKKYEGMTPQQYRNKFLST